MLDYHWASSFLVVELNGQGTKLVSSQGFHPQSVPSRVRYFPLFFILSRSFVPSFIQLATHSGRGAVTLPDLRTLLQPCKLLLSYLPSFLVRVGHESSLNVYYVIYPLGSYLMLHVYEFFSFIIYVMYVNEVEVVAETGS